MATARIARLQTETLTPKQQRAMIAIRMLAGPDPECELTPRSLSTALEIAALVGIRQEAVFTIARRENIQAVQQMLDAEIKQLRKCCRLLAASHKGDCMKTIESTPTSHVAASIARAVESGSLSKKLLRELAEKNGLEVTQEAAVACISALEKQRESIIPRKVAALENCMQFLFSEATAKKMGAWPRPAGYFEEQS